MSRAQHVSPPREDSDRARVVVVPCGDLDYFAVRRLIDVAATHLDDTETADRLVVDLSAVSFCDSSVSRLFDWARDVDDGVDLSFVMGDAPRRVLDLLPDRPDLLEGIDVR